MAIHQWGTSSEGLASSSGPGAVPAVGAANTVLASNGTTSEWDSSLDLASLAASSFVSVGSTVASTGDLRGTVSSNYWIRNSTNTADIRAIGGDGSNNIYVGTSATALNLHGNTNVALTTLSAQADFMFNGAITPTALSGDVNNYAPTGFSTCNAVRQDGGAANRNITGLSANNWRYILFTNIGTTNNLVLVHASGSSTAGNQFDLSNAANLTLLPRQSVILWYDAASTKWRALT